MKRIARWARAVRGSAGGVHIAAVRACAFAHRRPAADRRIAIAHVRPVSGLAPARAERAAGRHRRYRRGQPQGDRAMAVAAHGDRRSRHPAARARRRRRRLRHRVRRARPHVAGRRRRQLPRPRCGDARKACRASEQRHGLRRRDQKGRRYRRRASRRRAPAAARRARERGCKPDSPFAVPIRGRFWSRFPACCATSRRSSRPPPGAGYSPSIRSATASCAGCRSSWKRRADWCRP